MPARTLSVTLIASVLALLALWALTPALMSYLGVGGTLLVLLASGLGAVAGRPRLALLLFCLTAAALLGWRLLSPGAPRELAAVVLLSLPFVVLILLVGIGVYERPGGDGQR